MNHQIEVPATWGGIRRLMAFCDEVERGLLLSREQDYLIRLAIEEIATNIVKYSYPGRPGIIQVTCSYEDDALRLAICDRGDPFPPSAWPEPDMGEDPATRTVGGLGLYLVRAMADSLSYRHDDVTGWNELVLRKRRSG